MATEMQPAEIYEYLKRIAPPDAASGAVPTMTVCKYTGSFDEDHMFHGKGILHSTMGFCYDGEFVHGRMEGRGKMVWNSGITFTGDFNSNAPNGSGTLTWLNGDCYNGEIQHGVRHGQGTLTTSCGVYFGAWVQGRREGRGRQSYGPDSHYEGDWVANRRHGRGLLLYPGGDVYDGEWVHGERHGHGAMGWCRGGSHFTEVYDGTWRSGVPHGTGRATYVGDSVPCVDAAIFSRGAPPTPAAFSPPVAAVVNVYEGDWADGQRDGRGVFYYADGSVYEGEWRADEKSGRGRFTTSAGASVYTASAASDAWLHDFVVSADRIPAVSLDGILGVADGAPEEAAVALRLQLLQNNSFLRRLFDTCTARREGAALAVATPANWWRLRVPGHMALPQLLRMLEDARLLHGRVALREAVACVAATIEHEAAADRMRPDAQPQSERLRDLCAQIPRFAGAINFRQFVESLVRLAALAITGPGAACTVAGKFAALVEGPLAHVVRGAPEETAAPLCPATDRANGFVAPHLERLGGLFERLASCHESAQEPQRGSGGAEGALVPVRRLVEFAHAFLRRHKVGATNALARVLPFDRFAELGAAPPGICPPRNALGHRLYERSRGAHGELAAVRVADERMLTFVEFVELIVAFAEITGGEETVAERLEEILREPIPSKEPV